MTDALFKLASWLSPAYPVGAFAFSQGLEWAIAEGLVGDADALRDWIEDCLAHGAGRNDAILLAAAYRATDAASLNAVAELADALAPSVERLVETTEQGAAFAAVTAAAWGGQDQARPYPVAVGRAAAEHDVPLEQTVMFYLHAVAANLVGAGVRLVPLGQTDGQRVLAGLSPVCRRVADRAVASDLDAIGGCAVWADIASMRHETQPVRLFRS